MTNRAEDVNVFTRIEMSRIVDCYSNVIDCSLTDIKFIDFKELENEYVLIANVGMDVYRYMGEKIDKQYETLTLTLSGIKDMVIDNISVISMYECESCGSTVNLLNGGVCEYCGSKIPYKKYNFIIDNYRINEECVPEEQKIRKKLIITFFVAYALAVLGILLLVG